MLEFQIWNEVIPLRFHFSRVDFFSAWIISYEQNRVVITYICEAAQDGAGGKTLWKQKIGSAWLFSM